MAVSSAFFLLPQYAALMGSSVLPIPLTVPVGILIMFTGLGPASEVLEEVSTGLFSGQRVATEA